MEKSVWKVNVWNDSFFSYQFPLLCVSKGSALSDETEENYSIRFCEWEQNDTTRRQGGPAEVRTVHLFAVQQKSLLGKELRANLSCFHGANMRSFISSKIVKAKCWAINTGLSKTSLVLRWLVIGYLKHSTAPIDHLIIDQMQCS